MRAMLKFGLIAGYIETYVAISDELAFDLCKGYLFRPTTSQGDVVDKPRSSSSAQQRLSSGRNAS